MEEESLNDREELWPGRNIGVGRQREGEGRCERRMVKTKKGDRGVAVIEKEKIWYRKMRKEIEKEERT